MITFDLVNNNEILDELAKNVNRHSLEKLDKDDYGDPRIDWKYYLDMGAAGICKSITMRDKGQLAGYAIFTISTNPRHMDVLEAFCEGLFIEESYRSKHTKAFMNKINEYMKALKVNEIHFLIGNEKIGRFLSRNGYKETKKLWSMKYE